VIAAIDDGPSEQEGSLALVRAAAQEGTTVLAATPHLRADHPHVHPNELADRCATLNERISAVGAKIDVVPGGEVDLLWAHEASDAELRLVSYRQAGKDLLLETPYGALPPNFEQLLLQIAARGFRILLAHPERNRTLQARPQRVASLVRRGVLVQVTASSLALQRRSPVRKLAASLVSEGLAHVIASDAHHASGGRSPGLREGVEVAARLVGGRAEWMVTEAPGAILAGEPLPRPPLPPRARRGVLRRRFG
jgi:protein-tyrosine phosphatase